MADLTCNQCGGNDFYEENGFFICSECQTQAQDVQVQEFDRPDETIHTFTTRRIQSPASSKCGEEAAQITSWECYNYILLGLANELTELGASEAFKSVVHSIWFMYLRKIKVLHKDNKRPPALPAFKNKYDAKIVYGREKKAVKRKRKKTGASSAGSLSGDEQITTRRSQTALKRKMAVAAYEKSGHQSDDSDILLSNLSLSSLKSTNSEKNKTKIRYNKAAKAELLTHMTKKHLKEHIADYEGEIQCHNLSKRQLSYAYTTGPSVTTHAKLYCILHLALLICKEDIQLSDMMRFMKDGTLSYKHFNHFFPENAGNPSVFLNSMSIQKVNTYARYREDSTKLVQYLEMSSSFPPQNLPRLVRRYCKEMNLPQRICDICIAFLAETQVRMKVTRGQVPNYEAKAMCVIIFVLKLLFSLDGRTEFLFSQLALEVNRCRKENMFVFDKWLRCLIYRRLVLSKHHFPTQFANKQFAFGEYIDFVQYYNTKNDIQQVEDVDYDNIARFLQDNGGGSKFFEKFPPTLTPMQDYLKFLQDSGVFDAKNYRLDVLLANFDASSLDFILNAQEYLHEDVEHHDGGANYDIQMIPMSKAAKPQTDMLREEFQVEITKGKCSSIKDLNVSTSSLQNQTCSENVNEFESSTHKYAGNEEPSGETVKLHKYMVHHHPECKFWLRLGKDVLSMNAEAFDEYFLSFPQTFRHLVKETAALVSQTPKDILLEYNYFESYACYQHFESNKQCRAADFQLRRLFERAKQYW